MLHWGFLCHREAVIKTSEDFHTYRAARCFATMLSLEMLGHTETQGAYQSRTKICKIEFAQPVKQLLFLPEEPRGSTGVSVLPVRPHRVHWSQPSLATLF